MSWQIFKDNILRYANNPDVIQDVDAVAKIYATEYDAAVKRGFDTINNTSVTKGNVDAMTQLFKAALLKGQTSTAPYDLVGEMGNGVLAYWGGATLNNFPIPLIPAPGSTINVSIVSNSVTSPGVWQPPIVIPADSMEAAAAAVKRDIEVEYPISKEIYEAQFETKEEALENNSKVTKEEAMQNVAVFYSELEANPGDPNLAGDGDPYPYPENEDNVYDEQSSNNVKRNGKVTNDKLLKIAGNGIWPALGEPGNFEIQSSANGRTWYKQNPQYLKENCAQVKVPTINGDVEVTVHKNLAAIVKPVFAKIKSAGLVKYISTCGGGLAVRNVTGGTRLSNHAWGCAIDLNHIIYPFNYRFVRSGDKPGIYINQEKPNPPKFLRSFTSFDLGFASVADLFVSSGMTWLNNHDPMHVSIYE
jgi:hypothetical protein